MRSTIIALVALAALLLPGCAPSTGDGPDDGEPTVTETTQTPFVARDMEVNLVEVLDAHRYVVTAAKESSPRFGEEFTMRLVGLEAPREGECGHQESVAFIQQYWDRNPIQVMTYRDGFEPIGEDGDHQVLLNTRGAPGAASIELSTRGWARTNDLADADQAGRAAQAKEAGLGLWGLCPDTA